MTSFTEDMSDAGRKFRRRYSRKKSSNRHPDVARDLAVAKGAYVVYVPRVRTVGGVPKSIHHSYLPYRIIPSLDREPLVEGSLYKTLEQIYDVRPRRAEQRIRAFSATAKLRSFSRFRHARPS